MWLWHDTFLHFLYIVSPKEKKRKRNINNDLAVLPSHDIYLCRYLLATCRYWLVYNRSSNELLVAYSDSDWDQDHECNDRPHFIQVFTMMQPHGLLLCFISLHISNGSVSASLVGYVLYSADLMFAIYIPHSLLIVHRYIYSRYSPVFLMLYQLYHSLSSSIFNSSSSLYLSVATWVTP